MVTRRDLLKAGAAASAARHKILVDNPARRHGFASA
jgi:hypothetical protein